MSDFQSPEKAVVREASHKENTDSDELKEAEHILEIDPKIEDRILRKCDCEKKLRGCVVGRRLTFAQTIYFLGCLASGFAHSSTGLISVMLESTD